MNTVAQKEIVRQEKKEIQKVQEYIAAIEPSPERGRALS